jgi:hypothetical protein
MMPQAKAKSMVAHFFYLGHSSFLADLFGIHFEDKAMNIFLACVPNILSRCCCSYVMFFMELLIALCFPSGSYASTYQVEASSRLPLYLGKVHHSLL